MNMLNSKIEDVYKELRKVQGPSKHTNRLDREKLLFKASLNSIADREEDVLIDQNLAELFLTEEDLLNAEQLHLNINLNNQKLINAPKRAMREDAADTPIWNSYFGDTLINSSKPKKKNPVTRKLEQTPKVDYNELYNESENNDGSYCMLRIESSMKDSSSLHNTGNSAYELIRNSQKMGNSNCLKKHLPFEDSFSAEPSSCDTSRKLTIRNFCKGDPLIQNNEKVEYIGGLKRGVRVGEGKLRFTRSKQSLYEGMFYDGLFHGTGTLYNPHSIQDRELSKYWFINLDEFELWACYQGEFSSGYPEGQGKLIAYNGASIKCRFMRGRANGEGEVHLPNGQIQKFTWVDNKAKITSELGVN